MQFGIAFPSYIDAWREAEIAEASGFSHAWFYDTQLLCSDVYATMALAAEHTQKMILGTLVAIPSNRIAPVTATAVATINALAPGRVVLGLGTGFTGRNTMGMPAVPVSELERYAQQVRGLLAGEDVLFKQGKYERWIRLLHSRTEKPRTVNLDDPIEIHIAANAPKALAAAGRVGDGWITVAQSPEALPGCYEAIGTKQKPYTTLLTTGCILRDGETTTSPRVIDRVGPVAVVPMHAVWETAHGGAGLNLANEDGARSYGEYIDEIAARRGSPADRRYLDVHEGHMIYLKPGEEQFVNEDLISITLTGHADEVLERVRALRDAGVDNLALQVVGETGRELIEEFARKVIAKL
jgi:5,10-methylenetetrahydromethanopterin reductase